MTSGRASPFDSGCSSRKIHRITDDDEMITQNEGTSVGSDKSWKNLSRAIHISKGLHKGEAYSTLQAPDCLNIGLEDSSSKLKPIVLYYPIDGKVSDVMTGSVI